MSEPSSTNDQCFHHPRHRQMKSMKCPSPTHVFDLHRCYLESHYYAVCGGRDLRALLCSSRSEPSSSLGGALPRASCVPPRSSNPLLPRCLLLGRKGTYSESLSSP